MEIFQTRRVVLCAVALALVAAVGTAERPRVYCIEGATVIPEPGRQIDGGTVVLRDGLIEAVDAEIDPPADAVVIDGAGLWVYPGLIDASVDLGANGAESATGSGQSPARPGGGGRQAKTSPGPVHPLSLVHSERRASDTLLPFQGDRVRQAERLRGLGFTTVLALPGDGVFRGSSAAVLLNDDRPVSEIILRDQVAQHLSFARGGFRGGYPTSLMGTTAAIRQVILDTKRYAEWSQRYESDPQGMKRPDQVAAYRALRDAVEGRQSVIFHTDSPNDLLLAGRIADEFDLDAAIVASGHEWEVAEQLADGQWKLILPVAFPDKPKVEDDDEAIEVSIRSMRRYVEAAAGPAKLHRAGVTFALTTNGLKTLSDFKKNLGKIIAGGLDENTALAALTTVPASLLGIDRVTGTLSPGKLANVAVFDGPIFAEGSTARHIFVDGEEYLIEEKKQPKGGDPNAVVDPRGEWAVVFETPDAGSERAWKIDGAPGSFSGTAETRSGTVDFDDVRLEGNMLTVVLPGRGGRGAFELTVVITGDAFKGTAEFGPRTVPVKGTRTSGPEGGAR